MLFYDTIHIHIYKYIFIYISFFFSDISFGLPGPPWTAIELKIDLPTAINQPHATALTGNAIKRPKNIKMLFHFFKCSKNSKLYFHPLCIFTHWRCYIYIYIYICSRVPLLGSPHTEHVVRTPRTCCSNGAGCCCCSGRRSGCSKNMLFCVCGQHAPGPRPNEHIYIYTSGVYI